MYVQSRVAFYVSFNPRILKWTYWVTLLQSLQHIKMLHSYFSFVVLTFWNSCFRDVIITEFTHIPWKTLIPSEECLIFRLWNLGNPLEIKGCQIQYYNSMVTCSWTLKECQIYTVYIFQAKIQGKSLWLFLRQVEMAIMKDHEHESFSFFF